MSSARMNTTLGRFGPASADRQKNDALARQNKRALSIRFAFSSRKRAAGEFDLDWDPKPNEVRIGHEDNIDNIDNITS